MWSILYNPDNRSYSLVDRNHLIFYKNDVLVQELDGELSDDEGLVKFAKSKHIHADSFRQLVKGIRTKYHGWTYIQTIKG